MRSLHWFLLVSGLVLACGSSPPRDQAPMAPPARPDPAAPASPTSQQPDARPGRGPTASSRPAPAPTLIVTITSVAVLVADQQVSLIDDAVVDGRIPALIDALRARGAPDDGQVIVKAQRDTAASIITAVLESVRAAGYRRVALAVTGK